LSCHSDEQPDQLPLSNEIFDPSGAGSGCLTQNPDGQFLPYGDLIGGSAVLEDGPNEYKAWLFETGPWWYSLFP
jgi:hypothetical protein